MYKCKSDDCRLRRLCERRLSYLPTKQSVDHCDIFIDPIECAGNNFHFYADVLGIPRITIAPTRQFHA